MGALEDDSRLVTAPRFAWPLRGRFENYTEIARRSFILSARIIWKEHPPQRHVRKNWSPGLLACKPDRDSRHSS